MTIARLRAQPRAQESGALVPMPGTAALEITLTNMALPGDAPDGVDLWEGQDRQTVVGAAVLDALVEDALFEGRHTFFAGSDARWPFAVGLLNAPPRIVVDVMTGDPANPVALSQHCESPSGFSVAYPEGWAVNPRTTVAACTRFAPEEFTVPPGTDARVGAVVATVEAAPFSIGGLWPEGVRSTAYVVELGADGEGPRTLVVNTVGLPQFDHARNVRVLDRMIETVTLTGG